MRADQHILLFPRRWGTPSFPCTERFASYVGLETLWQRKPYELIDRGRPRSAQELSRTAFISSYGGHDWHMYMHLAPKKGVEIEIGYIRE